MIRYREILRLTALGISQRSIAGSVGCSKTTVQEVQRKAATRRLEWPLSDEMGDEAIRARLYPPQDRSDANKAEIDHEWVQREMGRRGAAMTLLWSEYAERAVAAGRTPYIVLLVLPQAPALGRRQPRVRDARRVGAGRVDAGRLGG